MIELGFTIEDQHITFHVFDGVIGECYVSINNEIHYIGKGIENFNSKISERSFKLLLFLFSIDCWTDTVDFHMKYQIFCAHHWPQNKIGEKPTYLKKWSRINDVLNDYLGLKDVTIVSPANSRSHSLELRRVDGNYLCLERDSVAQKFQRDENRYIRGICSLHAQTLRIPARHTFREYGFQICPRQDLSQFDSPLFVLPTTPNEQAVLRITTSAEINSVGDIVLANTADLSSAAIKLVLELKHGKDEKLFFHTETNPNISEIGNLIIVAGSGMGKSTVLRTIAALNGAEYLSAIEHYQQEYNYRVCLNWEEVQQELLKKCSVCKKNVDHAEYREHKLLLFDGLDEVTNPEMKDMLCHALNNLGEREPQVQIIVTTANPHDCDLFNQSFKRADLMKLELSEQEIKDAKGIGDFLTVPFFYDLYRHTGAGKELLAKNRYSFLNYVYNAYSSRKQNEHSQKTVASALNVLLPLIAAHVAHTDDLTFSINDIQPVGNLTYNITQLHWLTCRNYLRQIDEKTFSFCHTIWLDFLAARNEYERFVRLQTRQDVDIQDVPSLNMRKNALVFLSESPLLNAGRDSLVYKFIEETKSSNVVTPRQIMLLHALYEICEFMLSSTVILTKEYRAALKEQIIAAYMNFLVLFNTKKGVDTVYSALRGEPTLIALAGDILSQSLEQKREEMIQKYLGHDNEELLQQINALINNAYHVHALLDRANVPALRLKHDIAKMQLVSVIPLAYEGRHDEAKQQLTNALKLLDTCARKGMYLSANLLGKVYFNPTPMLIALLDGLPNPKLALKYYIMGVCCGVRNIEMSYQAREAADILVQGLVSVNTPLLNDVYADPDTHIEENASLYADCRYKLAYALVNRTGDNRTLVKYLVAMCRLYEGNAKEDVIGYLERDEDINLYSAYKLIKAILENDTKTVNILLNEEIAKIDSFGVMAMKPDATHPYYNVVRMLNIIKQLHALGFSVMRDEEQLAFRAEVDSKFEKYVGEARRILGK